MATSRSSTTGNSPWTTVVRLTLVEVRKVFTTRGSRTFLVVVASLGAVIAVAVGFLGDDQQVNAAAVLTVLGLMFTIAMPVVGVLIFTSDWQHREIGSVFLAQPHRSRSFVAKLIASLLVTALLLTAAAMVAGVLSAGLGMLLQRPLVWTGLDEAVPQLLAGSFVGVWAGAALGAALQNAIGAISLCFLQTLLIDPLLGFLPAGAGPYLMTGSITNFVAGGGALLPFVTAALLWLVAPLGIGFARHHLGEVS